MHPANTLEERGSRLVVVAGKSVDLVPRLVRQWNAARVVAQRWVEPFARERDLGIIPNPELLPGGEVAARQRLRRFQRTRAANYASHRDRMDLPGTSRPSPDLKFGTLSPRQVYHAIERTLGGTKSGEALINELVWREFAYSTLWDRPELLERPFRRQFADFPYENAEGHWRAWTAGATGYRIVDALARELLRTGFVHNRARMISASFLTKQLLVSYRHGEAHYLRYLTDGDWASNNAGWQWAAGCGCDAQRTFAFSTP